MGKGGNQGEGSTELQAPMPTFRWEEIQKHNLRTDRWLVIDRKVYNVTKWSQRHPGGHRVIGHYSGEDATVRVWGCRPFLSAAGWCQEPGVPGRQTDLQFLMERRTSNRERKYLLLSSRSRNRPPLGPLGRLGPSLLNTRP